MRRICVWSLPLALVLIFPASLARGDIDDLQQRYLCLDGSGDYASVPDSASLDLGTEATDDFTIETFFYVPDLTNDTTDGLIWKDRSFGLSIAYNATVAGGADRILFRIWTDATQQVLFFNDTNLSIGWHHIAAVWDNEFTASEDHVAVYLDGTRIISQTSLEMTPGLINSTDPVFLGSSWPHQYAVGRLEEVRFSSVVRYSGASITVPSAPFAVDGDTRALWHFDETPGTTSFADSSPNANTATGVGNAQTCGAASCPAITVTPSTLPAGEAGSSYSQTLGVSGGTAPYGFAVTSGALPSGLTLSSGGSLSGILAAAGSYDFTVTATDNNGCTGSRAYTLVIEGAPSVNVAPTSVTVYEGGATATFEVVLGTPPSGNVVVDVVSNNTAIATVDKSDLTFSTGDWSTPQVVTVTAVNDAVDDGDQNTVIVLTIDTAATADPDYDALNPPDVNVTAVDNDTAGVSVVPTAVSVNEAGSTATFDVVLTSQPTGTVVVDVVSGDTGEAIVDKAELTFGAGTWSIPQTVTVTGVDDGVSDGDQQTVIALTIDTVKTVDAVYDTVNPPDVVVTTFDDEVVAVLSTGPASNDPSVLRTTNVQVTAEENVIGTTVTAATFVVHGSMSGRLTGTYSSSGATFQFDPGASLIPGEKVYATATRDIDGLSGAPLRKHVWEFIGATSGASGSYVAHSTAHSFGSATNRELAVGDLDGDGDVDAITAATFPGSDPAIWLNSGNGTFTAHPTAPTFSGTEVNGLALGDLDGDGDLDAIVARWYAEETAWMNDGSGVFAQHSTSAPFPRQFTYDVALGDLDGDGDLDAVFANSDAGTGSNAEETVWLNDGTGAFAAHPTVPSFGGDHTTTISLADLDNDGDLDAIAGTDGDDRVWLNDGTGVFTPHPTAPVIASSYTFAQRTGDLDGDGDVDLINAGVGMTTWLNDGSGAFSPHPSVPAFAAAWTHTDLDLGDVDGDGDLDVAFDADEILGEPGIWANDGTGVFTRLGVVGSERLVAVRLVDLDGDNDLDLLGTEQSAGQRVWLNRAAAAATLISSVNPSLVGQSVTFTAHVTSPAGTPAGSVTFKDGDATLATRTLSSGSATYTTSTLTEGTHSITAHYGGNTTWAPDVSPVIEQVVNLDDFGAPAILWATATLANRVVLGWTAVDGATSYQIQRTASIMTAFAPLASTSTLAYNDNTVTANTTYLYKVRAVGTSGTSDFSPVDAATTVIFTDPTLTGATRVKALHFTQLRTAIDAMRTAANLAPASYTNAIATGNLVKRIDLLQMRTALNEARSGLAIGTLTFAETIIAGSTKIKAAHISEIRAGTQ